MKHNELEHFAAAATRWTGSTPAFIAAVGIIIVWLITGPIFHFSDTWQLVINTGTTIITFLMVFLIQRTQNKDSLAIQIKLNEQDIKRANQIRSYPWFEHKKAWQKEIDLMLKNGFKLEVESLISKDISYVTEEYVPQRLEEGEFLD